MLLFLKVKKKIFRQIAHCKNRKPYFRRLEVFTIKFNNRNFKNLSRHGSLRQKRVQVFETGSVFEATSGKLGLKEKDLKTKESLHIAWGLMGHREEATWLQDKTSKLAMSIVIILMPKGFGNLYNRYCKI